jgi:hypothetical protein
VLGLRKYAGLYSLPAGLGLFRAILPELLVLVLLLLDREVATATGAYERGALGETAHHAAAVGRRGKVVKGTDEAKMRMRDASGLPTGEDGARNGRLASWPDSVRVWRLRRRSAAGDDDQANASKAETGSMDVQSGPGSGKAILRDTAALAPRSVDLLPMPPAASWWERPNRSLAGARSSPAASMAHGSGSCGMAGGASGETCGSSLRWPVHGVSGFVDRLLVVDFSKSGAALYLASFGVSVTILGWSLFHFARIAANSSSYSTRCFDPVSGARQSLSASQFDAATVVSVLIAFGVIIADRSIYRIWRPPSAPTSRILPDVPAFDGAPNPIAGNKGAADSPVGLPSSRESGGVSQASSGGGGAPRHRSVALGLKLCLHIALVSALHAHTFFGALPAWQCESECASSRMTCERSGTLQFFYMLCCLYLLISARQVRMAPSDPAVESCVGQGEARGASCCD